MAAVEAGRGGAVGGVGAGFIYCLCEWTRRLLILLKSSAVPSKCDLCATPTQRIIIEMRQRDFGLALARMEVKFNYSN